MAKRVKSGKRVAGKLLLVVLLVAAGIAGAWYINLKMNGPSNGRETFTFTQLVNANDTSECVHVEYYGKKYCIDDWNKVYSAMDTESQTVSTTLNANVKITFDADFHTSTMEFTENSPVPTLILNKVYSATAIKL